MRILTNSPFRASRRRRILRNLVLISGMGLILISFTVRPNWASEIIFVFGCTDLAIMPPGGLGVPSRMGPVNLMSGAGRRRRLYLAFGIIFLDGAELGQHHAGL
jgi:hypothetical protein